MVVVTFIMGIFQSTSQSMSFSSGLSIPSMEKNAKQPTIAIGEDDYNDKILGFR